MSALETREEFLKQPNIAVLATISPRGRLHAMPMWYLYEDGVFIMSTVRGRQKQRNIENHGEATLVIDKRTVPYYAVMVQGAAEIGPSLSEELHRKIAFRYLDDEMAKEYIVKRPPHGSVSIRLYPRQFIEYSGISGKLASG